MATTLGALRDRLGHTLICLIAGGAVAVAAPGDYKAQRFDVTARAAGGALAGTESITFEFQSGTFTKVWREIPASRTDGIAVLSARIDGTPLTLGDGPGHYSVSGRNKVRIEWRFPELGPSVHRFDRQ